MHLITSQQKKKKEAISHFPSNLTPSFVPASLATILSGPLFVATLPHWTYFHRHTTSPNLGDLFLFSILMGPTTAIHNPPTFSSFYLFH